MFASLCILLSSIPQLSFPNLGALFAETCYIPLASIYNRAHICLISLLPPFFPWHTVVSFLPLSNKLMGLLKLAILLKGILNKRSLC